MLDRAYTILYILSVLSGSSMLSMNRLQSICTTTTSTIPEICTRVILEYEYAYRVHHCQTFMKLGLLLAAAVSVVSIIYDFNSVYTVYVCFQEFNEGFNSVTSKDTA